MPKKKLEIAVKPVKEQISKLVKKGKADGFITLEEVLKIFPKPEEHLAEVDDLFYNLQQQAIDVFDTTVTDILGAGKGEELEKELVAVAVSEGVSDPVHMVETINKFSRISRRLMQELGREPTPEEVAVEMDIGANKVREIMKIAQEPTSLETPVGEEEDSHLGDFIPSTEKAPLESASEGLLKEDIVEVLSTLTPREAKVIELRFGLKDGRARTLEEVGKEFSVTRERIRQIEAKALRKLRHPSRSRKLRDYLELRTAA